MIWDRSGCRPFGEGGFSFQMNVFDRVAMEALIRIGALLEWEGTGLLEYLNGCS